MPKGYWIPHLDVPDMDKFNAYRTTADTWHKTNGSRLLARGGRREAMEGTMRARNVLREFDSFDAALAAYRSPEYTHAHELREGHALCDFAIVEGHDGYQPQPIGTLPAPGAVKGYWIAHIDILDAEGYKPYQTDNARAFGKYGAKYLVRGGRQQVTEGRQRSRTVVIEYPSYDAALACYRSPEYQEVKALRMGHANVDLLAIEGYDGRQ